jgi:hypothetical protein
MVRGSSTLSWPESAVLWVTVRVSLSSEDKGRTSSSRDQSHAEHITPAHASIFFSFFEMLVEGFLETREGMLSVFPKREST